eukprot:scaffold82125_cov43-Phaeocystis_antarctica.AAC.1
MFSACALPHRHSAGRPCWTKTERQGLVDGALGPADDVRDVWTSQTSTAVAARDGAQPIAQQALPAERFCATWCRGDRGRLSSW